MRHGFWAALITCGSLVLLPLTGCSSSNNTPQVTCTNDYTIPMNLAEADAPIVIAIARDDPGTGIYKMYASEIQGDLANAIGGSTAHINHIKVIMQTEIDGQGMLAAELQSVEDTVVNQLAQLKYLNVSIDSASNTNGDGFADKTPKDTIVQVILSHQSCYTSTPRSNG